MQPTTDPMVNKPPVDMSNTYELPIMDKRESGYNNQKQFSKLFVGQIPKHITEQMLRPYFDDFGQIMELCIMRDYESQMSKGSAFVTYVEEEPAARAIRELHNKVKLPFAHSPLQVKLADDASVSEHDTANDSKLFVGMLNKSITEDDLLRMFGDFGEINEVHIIRATDGSPKGCAFVRFVDMVAANAAIEGLHDTVPSGSFRPLVVRFAEKSRKTHRDHQNEGFIPHGHRQPTYTRRDFRSSSYYDNSRFHSINGPYRFLTDRQSSAESILAVAPGFAPVYNDRPQPINIEVVQHRHSVSPQQQNVSIEGLLDELSLSPSIPINSSEPLQYRNVYKEGPLGANLFIYHLPRDATDEGLANLFSPFGNVISATVFLDKKTGEPKGFGFVSYDNMRSAHSAINAMNSYHIGNKKLKVTHKQVNHKQMQYISR